MSAVDAPSGQHTAASRLDDGALVRRCLKGDESAWSALVDRYQRLIFSIPLKYGVTFDEAGEIFQAVCVEMVTELPKLRKPEALKAWLISVTQHRALKVKTRALRERQWAEFDAVADTVSDPDPGVARAIEEVQRDQAVRECVRALPERCQELVRLLFFHEPPLPYAEVAARLALAVGSIGFIRGRCLKKLEAALRARGL